MPARNGRQYLDGLRAQERLIYMGGERVRDVTKHPGLASGARAVAALYDMQHDPKLHGEMTYKSPTSGEPVGLSFIIPRTQDDLIRRRTMMLHWARATCGMMGRSPDFMNVTYAAWAGAADYFARGRPAFADNMRHYYEHIRENDLVLTHALVNLQRSRSASGLYNL
jgi:4-hydroxyphenylacetate 3-monooxygenase